MEKKNFRRFLLFLYRLRDVVAILGGGDNAFEKVSKDLEFRLGISAENINFIIEGLEGRLVSEFKRIFGEDLKFSIEQYDALRKRWGDLSPIHTLVARFQRNPNWKKEILILKRVFQAVLEDRFFEYKFRGNSSDPKDLEAAKEQLSVLFRTQDSEKAFRGWTTVQSEAQAVLKGGWPNEEQILAQLKTDLSQMKDHLRDAFLQSQEKIPSQDQAQDQGRIVIDRILKKRESSKDLFKSLLKEASGNNASENNEIKVVLEILEGLKGVHDTSQVKKVLVFLKETWFSFPSSFDIHHQIGEDIETALSRFSEVSYGKKGGRSVVFVTTFHDPKLLLTIGDVVKGVSSCQNYKTGSYIQTLLGYVVDANVQGILGFEIEEKDFKDSKEFDVLWQKFKNDSKNIRHYFDPATQRATFEWEEDGRKVEIKTKELSAQSRNIVKLGASDGKPGIFVERAYCQMRDDAVHKALSDGTQNIVSKMASEMGGVVGGSIEIEGSRNSGGVYSDAAGGVMTGRYRIESTRSDRGQIDLRLLGIPSREALVENGSSLAKILLAEEIKELYFSITNWDSQRIVAYNKQLIENPVEMLVSLEGFVLTEKAAQKALGFQNGQALDIQFLEKWPTVHKFAMSLKRHLPMAIAMGVMESLRKISERKDLLEGLERADLLERELFYVEVNNAILQSVILYANASCDVLSDPETYKIISRKVGQFIVAGNVVYYGKKVAQLGRLYCQGAKVRTAVEAGSMTFPGFAAATLDLAATMVIEEYLNGMVDRFIRWWEEWGYTDNIRQAQDHILHFKKDPQIDDPLPAIQNLKDRIQEYEDYLMKDVKLALLSGEMGAKDMEGYYTKRIEDIKNRRPHRKYGEYVATVMGKSIPQGGEIEESYEKTKTGWRIRRAPVIDGKPTEGATGYWGAVETPAQFQEMADEEFGRYTEELIRRAEKDRTETACAIREAAKKNALSITDRVYAVITPVIKEQITFLETQFPNLTSTPELIDLGR